MTTLTRTTRTTTSGYESTLIKINGREYGLEAKGIRSMSQVQDFGCIEKIEKGASNYEWNVTDWRGRTFVVWGGKAAGGSKTDWFIDSEFGTTNYNSLVESLNTLCGR